MGSLTEQIEFLNCEPENLTAEFRKQMCSFTPTKKDTELRKYVNREIRISWRKKKRRKK